MAAKTMEVKGLGPIEHKFFVKGAASNPLEIREVDLEARTFEGDTAGIGNRDSYDDIILPGAFKRSISERVTANSVKLLDHHRSYRIEHLWGTVTKAREILDGKTSDEGIKTGVMRATFYVSRKQGAQDALRDVADGICDGMSIGFRAVRTEYVKDEGAPDDIDPELAWYRSMGTRRIKELAWWESSLVIWGANDIAAPLPATLKSLQARAEAGTVDEKSVLRAIRTLKTYVDPELLATTDGLTGLKQDLTMLMACTEHSDIPDEAKAEFIQLVEDLPDMERTFTVTVSKAGLSVMEAKPVVKVDPDKKGDDLPADPPEDTKDAPPVVDDPNGAADVPDVAPETKDAPEGADDSTTSSPDEIEVRQLRRQLLTLETMRIRHS